MNLFSLLDRSALRFPEHPAVCVGTEGVFRHAELRSRCSIERIARFKRPKRYVFVESLPKNSYGKVLKRELRRWHPAKAGTT